MQIIFGGGKKKKVPKRKCEYTKVIISFVAAAYFLTLIFAVVIVWLEREYIGELLAFVGAPSATAIGFYCWKAKNENLLKIKNALYDKEIKLRRELKDECDAVTSGVNEKLYEFEEDI